jgi:hypothetical protein
VDESDQIMVAWQTADGGLLYTTWQANDTPPAVPDCVPVGGPGWQPQLIDAQAGQYLLAYDTALGDPSGEIAVFRYDGSDWSSPLAQASGHSPSLYQDEMGQAHVAWCGSDGLIHYQPLDSQGATEKIDFPKCDERPAFSEDGYGRLHLIWHSDEIANNHGVVSEGNFLYESVRLEEGWSEPALIVRPGETSSAVVVATDDKALLAAWADASSGIQQATQPHYTCEESTGSYLGDAILAVTASGLYRPADEQVPYCQARSGFFRSTVYQIWWI